jgi:hypothetical protein
MRFLRRFRRERNRPASEPVTPEGLAALLGSSIFDRQGAAEFLGVSLASIEMAAWRQRLPLLTYKGLRLFTRQDLLDYDLARGTGRASRLSSRPMYAVVGRQVVRLEPPTGGGHRGYDQ